MEYGNLMTPPPERNDMELMFPDVPRKLNILSVIHLKQISHAGLHVITALG
jgi:hypothetical protein